MAAAISLVVLTFGYAITGDHANVWLGAGCGLAIGVGVGLRGGARGSLWTGILIGSAVGVVTALLTSSQYFGLGLIIPPSTPLAIGLIDGLGRSSLSGYLHLVLSVGWALVLFAAVMTSIEPKLARIARRHADEDTD